MQSFHSSYALFITATKNVVFATKLKVPDIGPLMKVDYGICAN